MALYNIRIKVCPDLVHELQIEELPVEPHPDDLARQTVQVLVIVDSFPATRVRYQFSSLGHHVGISL